MTNPRLGRIDVTVQNKVAKVHLNATINSRMRLRKPSKMTHGKRFSFMNGLAGKVLILLLAVMVLEGCSKNREGQYIAGTVGFLYNEGKKNLDRNNYPRATAFFNEVERQHPYTQWARRAQLMAAYSNYLDNEYDEAILASERFLAVYPGNQSAPYAWYLIAMSYYEQITDVGRDQRITENAQNAFRQIIARYPGTAYERDAQLKLDLTRDHLAGKEMEVGRFYQGNREYLAALLRFRSVIDNYQTTTHVEEAMHRLVEVYLALGIVDEALQVAAVLGFNYPKSKWYKYSYALLSDADLADQIPDEIPRKKKKFLGIFGGGGD